MKKIIFILSTLLLSINLHAQMQLFGLLSGACGTQSNASSLLEWKPSTNNYIKKFIFTDTNGSGGEPFGSLTLHGGNLYGMTSYGGTNNAGVIFEWNPMTNIYTKKIDFTSTNGSMPLGSLIFAGGKFYGMTWMGGANNAGVIFEWDPTTNIFTKKKDFDSYKSPLSNGSNPYGSLTFSGGKFYGMTYGGGANNMGVIFEWDPVTNIYINKIDLSDSLGSYPYGDLTLYGNKFYGMTLYGGVNDDGVIFEWDPTTNIFTKKKDFDSYKSPLSNGSNPYGSLTLSGGKFYGMTYYGGTGASDDGAWGGGVIFEWDPVTNIYTKKIDLSRWGAIGCNPYGSLTMSSGKFYGMARMGGFGLGVIFEWNLTTNTYTKKIDLSLSTGGCPYYSQFIEYCPGIPDAPINITAPANQIICSGYSTTTLSASGIGTLSWYDNPTGGNYLGGGANFISPVLKANTSFYVQDSTCTASPTRTEITITVHQLSVPTNTTPPYNQLICSGTSTVLFVSDSLGALDTLKWYSGCCGGTFIDTGNTITVSPTTTTTYYVRVEGYCCTTSCIAIQVNVIPITLATPGAIAGNSTVCMGVAENYSVPAVSFATNYSWSFPPGITINNGQGSDSVNVTAGGAGQNGDINVTASNSCSTSGTTTFPIIVHPGTPIKPWDIKGNITACAGVSEVYSTPDIPGASNYLWSFPTGWTITSGQGNDTVTVHTGAMGNDGDIIVNAGNSCGTSGAYSIAVTVAQCNGLNLKLFLEGFYTGTGSMRAAKTYNPPFGFIPKWSPTIADTIAVELHDTANYANIIYSAFGIILKTDGTAGLSIPANDTGSYYITVKHRNHLKTISANPVSFAGGNANYDFTTNINKAFGNNQKNMNGAAAIYAGDITSKGYNYPGTAFPDGVIDISDVYYVFNSYLNGDFGYLLGDVSGDGTVDLTDVYLAFNNYLLGVYAVTLDFLFASIIFQRYLR